MGSLLPNCWEVMGCGREKGGPKAGELGECIASKESLGHSCWAIAGTLCGGVVQGNALQKKEGCILCDIYKMYNRITGTKSEEITNAFPEEESKYNKLLVDRLRKLAIS